MEALLASHSCAHLAWVASELSLTDATRILADGSGRATLIARLKEIGVDRLPERQVIATAVARAKRELALPQRAARPPRALQPPPQSDGGEPVDWLEWASGWTPVVGEAHRRTAPATDAVPATDADPAAAVPSSWLDRIMVIDGVLTPAECARLVSRAKAAPFQFSEHQGKRDEGFRRGSRAPLTDGGLAAEIFSRIAHVLRAHAERHGRGVERGGAVVGETARPPPVGWGAPAGIWEQLRILSYGPGDFFLPHRDYACALGGSALLPTCRSCCSLLLYLADSEDGSGATRFHDDAPPIESAAREESLTSHASVADVVPWAGRAVIFPHAVLHESLPVSRGRKYVMRGDILYQPQDEGCL